MPHYPDDPFEPDRPLTTAYRLLRRVTPPDAPFAGWLAHRHDGETVQLVAARELADWEGFAVPTDGHVLAATDLVRTAEGTAVELPWCPHRVTRVLAQRATAGAPITAGEAVTLAVSCGRGLAELSAARPRRTREWPQGEWWLTDAARPVFVHSAQGGPAHDVTAALLDRVAEQVDDARLADAIRRMATAAAADEGLDPARVEAELFALAEPAPVRPEAFAPRSSRSLDSVARLGFDTEAAPPPSGSRALLERHLDSELSAMVSDAVHGAVRWVRARPRPKPWLLAAGAAAVVIAAGALWPNGDADPATARAGGPAPSPAQTQTTPPSPTSAPRTAVPTADATEAAASDGSDFAQLAAHLLDARLACRDDAGCLAEVVERPDARLPAGAIDLPPTQRTVTFLDEFGGAAVVRVEAAGAATAAQLVVIVESDGRWLLRDVHDVAPQD